MSKYLEQYKSGFSGILKLIDLRPFKHGFKCPCGGTNHVALFGAIDRTAHGLFVSPILHCYETRQMWYLERNIKTDDVATIIKEEEVKFIALLDKFERTGLVGKTVSGKEAFKLATEQGVPIEILDLDMTAMAEYNKLLDEHKQISKQK